MEELDKCQAFLLRCYKEALYYGSLLNKHTLFCFTAVKKVPGPVVQTLDSDKNRINEYPVDRFLGKPIALYTGKRFIQWIALFTIWTTGFRYKEITNKKTVFNYCYYYCFFITHHVFPAFDKITRNLYNSLGWFPFELSFWHVAFICLLFSKKEQ